MVDDVNKTVAFYADALGFTKVMSVPEEGELRWALMENGSVQIMFQKITS